MGVSREKAIRKIKKRDGSGNCHYCGARLDNGEITLDHVISNSQIKRLRTNGIDLVLGWRNYVISCEWCNQNKADMDYRRYCEKIGKVVVNRRDLIFDLEQLEMETW
jgi:5-methylcytosine-specific restriction endonuclease McrA